MLGISGRMVGSETQWSGGFNQQKTRFIYFYTYKMKKILQLLNEYERSLWSDREWLWIIDEDWFFCTRKSKKGNPIVQHSSLDEAILQIISKKFWFIQWLVGMVKIDYEAWHKVFIDSNYFGNISDLYEYEVLTMYLSIQDDPIEFLISILK